MSTRWCCLLLQLSDSPPVPFFLFPLALICRPYCSKPNPPLAFHSLLSTSLHADSLRLCFLSLPLLLPRSPVHLSVHFSVNPPTLCNLALRSLLTLNCSRPFQSDGCQAHLWLSAALLFKSRKGRWVVFACVCACLCACLHASAGCCSLAAFDCRRGITSSSLRTIPT